ncbi:hypothetical protein [Streptomyces sp. NPDC020983]|uniref:hypothetical protein n=1 Tax=Streptomyces sp. NPDC020983 TaxID=3365106 RepID=UPI00378FE1AD
MRGLSRYESTVALRYGIADTADFTRQALAILDTRAGDYRGYGVTRALIHPLTLRLGSRPGRAGVVLRTGATPHTTDPGAVDLDVAVEPGPGGSLRLTGLGPLPLPLRRGSVDAVRCATLVFGLGDIDGEGPSAEFGVTVRPEAGLQCAYAAGTDRDPYAPRWEISVRAAAVAHRSLPVPSAMGWIAADCLA